MWIRLSEISPKGVLVSDQTPLAKLGLEQEDWRAEGPVRVDLRVTRDEEIIMVDGQISAPLRVACSRCVEECAYPVSASLHLFLAPADDDRPEGVHQLHADELEQLYYRQGGLETNDVVREQLLLAIPMRVLCRPACRGLCPSCGHNLNEGSCDCPPPANEPRGLQLKRLLQ
jgi:uncharacterized protein